jgi:diguanylate cyclase (GGDEF)-like protein/PAS domain S-box-containing protein
MKMTDDFSQAGSPGRQALCLPEMLPEQFYKTLLDSLFDAVYTVDLDGRITYWNDSCSRITGYASQEMIGKRYRDTAFAFNRSDAEGASRPPMILSVLTAAMPGTWKGYIQRKNGQRIPVMAHISPLFDQTGAVIGAVEVLQDISTQIALEEAHRQLLHISRRDMLTGLYNRSSISEQLKAELERSRRYQQPLSIIMADIDFFKRINDQYGHDAGDKVLAKIGSVLIHNMRKPDVVGRWGGEEFLIIAPASPTEAAAVLAERIREYIKQIPTSEIPTHVTASFGVAQYAEGMGHDQILNIADQALYQAKTLGRDRVSVADPKTKKL